MLASFFKIVLADAPSDVVEMINNLVVEMYKKKGITERTNFTTLPADKYPIFDDLYDLILEKMKS